MPWQLRDDGVPKSAMTIIAKDVGIVMDEARLSAFPLPLCGVAEQVFTAALGAGMMKDDDGLIVRMWERFGGKPIQETGTEQEEIEKAKELEVSPSGKPSKVAFIGLGVMGAGMALAVQKAGLEVMGYDVNLEAIDRYTKQGGKASSDVQAAAKGAEVVVLMTNTAEQAEAILFGDGKSGICSCGCYACVIRKYTNQPAGLPEGSTIILCATVAPADTIRIQSQLNILDRDLQLVDAPVSGGPSRTTTGDLAIMASGQPKALSRACSVLQAMSTQAGNTKNLHFIRERCRSLCVIHIDVCLPAGGVGSGSKVKAVNQLLASVHLCAAAEALAFARKKGMNLDDVIGVVSKGAASSYMLDDRERNLVVALYI